MTTGQDQILTAVRDALAQELGAKPAICLGLSGGLDSVVLLHALAELRAANPFELSALHVHHGLSPNAEEWAAFCQTLCAELNVVCQVVRLQLPSAAGKGIERVAREARYKAFTAASGHILCLAHHQNDRAETLLLNLFRGAGPVGLAGVPESRWLGQKRLLRPLLEIPRSALQAWATTRGLRWIEDESNDDLGFRRNYVRHRVLPVVTQAFPGAVGVLARTSAQMAEQAALLDRLAEVEAQTCRDSAGLLSVEHLQQLPKAAVRNILRFALNQVGVRIPAARRLEQLSSQLISATPDTEAFVRMGEAGVHLWRGHLWVDLAMNTPGPGAYALSAGAVDWPDGVFKIEGALTSDLNLSVGPVGHGRRFQPAGRCRDRVSELLRAQGVPPWVRPRLPGLWKSDTLVWVATLGWSHDLRSASLTDALRVVWAPISSCRL